MNEFVIRTYFRITQCESMRTGYRQPLHQVFTNNFSNLNLTEQNIADRRSAIFRRNLVPENIRARIRDEVHTELLNRQSQNYATDNYRSPQPQNEI